jgi:tetratricopeptide (TPR) repeat protein
MNLRWHLSHARGYLELGMVREAAAELDAIPDADSDRLEVCALRVALLHERCDWRALRRLAEVLVTRQPAEAGWWVSLAFATRRADSLEKARAILIEAEKLHGTNAVVQFNLGCYACQLGELDEARLRLRRAITLNEDFRDIAQHDPDLEPLRAADGASFAA